MIEQEQKDNQNNYYLLLVIHTVSIEQSESDSDSDSKQLFLEFILQNGDNKYKKFRTKASLNQINQNNQYEFNCQVWELFMLNHCQIEQQLSLSIIKQIFDHKIPLKNQRLGAIQLNIKKYIQEFDKNNQKIFINSQTCQGNCQMIVNYEIIIEKTKQNLQNLISQIRQQRNVQSDWGGSLESYNSQVQSSKLQFTSQSSNSSGDKKYKFKKKTNKIIEQHIDLVQAKQYQNLVAKLNKNKRNRQIINKINQQKLRKARFSSSESYLYQKPSQAQFNQQINKHCLSQLKKNKINNISQLTKLSLNKQDYYQKSILIILSLLSIYLINMILF